MNCKNNGCKTFSIPGRKPLSQLRMQNWLLCRALDFNKVVDSIAQKLVRRKCQFEGKTAHTVTACLWLFNELCECLSGSAIDELVTADRGGRLMALGGIFVMLLNF